MRLSFITLFLSSFSLVSSVLAAKPNFLSRHDRQRSPVPSVLTTRQHRVTRDLLDVCINVDADLLADASQLLGLGPILGPLDLGTTIHLCLCLKDLDLYLETNDEIQALVALLGKDTVRLLLEILLNPDDEGHQCSFPPHAHHTCNNSDPCHYECDPHYIRNGDTCVCAPPYTSCNGVCDIFPQGCSSAVPRSLKARAEPVVTLAQGRAACKPRESVCGIEGREKSLAFECIDVSSKTDSCGGCMTHHPFFEEEPILYPSGQDCSSIPNVKSVGCSESRCNVHSCKEGWVPGVDSTQCVPDASSPTKMRRVTKRSDPLSADASAGATIDSDLLRQLSHVLDLVLNLNALLQATELPTSSTDTPTPAIAPILSSLNNVNIATGSLITSQTVPGLLASVDALLGSSTALSSEMGSCGCAGDLGLSDFVQKLDSLIADLLDLQYWCSHHPIVPASGGGSASTVAHPTITGSAPESSATSAPEQSIVIGLSDLLSSLGLDGKSGVIVNGLLASGATASVNNVLNSLDLGPKNYRRHSVANVDPRLLGKITAIVNIVVKLPGDGALLPAVGAHPGSSVPASVNANMLGPIIKTTGGLLTAQTTSSLLSSINSLVTVSTNTQQLLHHCNCVNSLGLQNLVKDLDLVVSAALDAQTWCHGHSVTIPSPSSPSHPSPASGGDVPIVVELTHVLNGLGIPVKSSAVVGGLGSGLGSDVNGLLNGLGIGPTNAKRASGTSANANAVAAIDPTLLSHLTVLVNLAIDLEGAMNAAPPATTASCPGLLNSHLVQEIVDAVGAIAQSSTTSSIVAGVNRLITSDTALQGVLGKCTCQDGLDDVLEYLVLLVEAALDLESSCGSHPSSAPHSTGAPHLPASPTVHPASTSVHHTSSSHQGSATTSHTSVTHASASHPVTTLSISIGVSAGTHGPGAASHTSAHPAPTSAPPTHPPPPPPSTPADSDDALIVSLNQLLSSLGLGGVKGVVTVNGLGPGLTSTGNGLLNGLGIGPNNLRRAPLKRTAANATANATVDSDIDVQTAMYALIDLEIGMNDVAGNLPSAGPPSNPSPPSVPPIGSPPAIDSNLTHGIISATAHILTAPTYEHLVSGVDALAVSSVLSLKALDGCGCVSNLHLDALYNYITRIVDLALALQEWCHEHPAYPSVPHPGGSPLPSSHTGAPQPAHSSTGTAVGSGGSVPLVVGLSKLLNGLGLHGKSGVVVDGLLGNALDESLNSVLDGLGLGPSAYRR